MNKIDLETKIEGLKKAIAEHKDFTGTYESQLKETEQELKDYNKVELTPMQLDDIYEAVEAGVEQFDWSDTDNFEIEYEDGSSYDGNWKEGYPEFLDWAKENITGEEGLDISECNLVVFYDNVPSSIRFVQRKGRTGRKAAGRVVVLMTKDTLDEAYYWISKRKMRESKNMARKMNGMIEKEKPSLDKFMNG